MKSVQSVQKVQLCFEVTGISIIFTNNFGIKMVGARGFEPPTPCSQSRCATRLRYAPTSYYYSMTIATVYSYLYLIFSQDIYYRFLKFFLDISALSFPYTKLVKYIVKYILCSNLAGYLPYPLNSIPQLQRNKLP